MGLMETSILLPLNPRRNVLQNPRLPQRGVNVGSPLWSIYDPAGITTIRILVPRPVPLINPLRVRRPPETRRGLNLPLAQRLKRQRPPLTQIPRTLPPFTNNLTLARNEI